IIFFNQNYILILITWGLNAVAQFGVWPGVFKILSSQLVPDQRKQAVFFISFSSTLGLMVAYIIAALVRRWESNFAIASAVLFALTIFFHIVAKRMEPHMVPDTVPRGVHSDEPIKLVKHNLPTKKLLLLGGVIFVVVYILLRAMVENGVKTLSSTMLMESYTQISPSIGNLLNTLIILSSVVGICFVRYVLSRFIKDEIVSTTLLLLVSLPLTLVLRHVGQGSAWIMVLSMCIIVAALNGTHYLSLAYNMRFTRYGLNATVAGIVNASASFGLVLQNYGFPLLAETTSWNYVANTWAIMLGISALALIVFLPRWKRFIAMENAEEIVEETV
ncbi:MAG: MFS transporter, partial [Clostridia bacterium]|nr:MFS transporter [Clostridia bacterium]